MSLIRILALSLSICAALSSFGEDESVIRGQIHGIDKEEGAWVGIATGAPSYKVSWLMPLDEFEADEALEGVTRWIFTKTGKFELKTRSEEDSVLLVVAKNRLPLEIPLPLDDDANRIEASLAEGVGLRGIVRDEDGKPLENATVSISASGKKYEIPSFTMPNWVTGVDGSFFVKGLVESNDYELRVTADGHAPLVNVRLKIPEHGIEGLEIGLEKGYFVSGRVIGESGLPLAAAVIKARWERIGMEITESHGGFEAVRGGGGGVHTTSTRSTVDGSYQVGPFAKGTTGRVYAGSATIGTAVSSEVSAPYSDLVLRLGREFVRGRVLDRASGAPLAKFTINMFIGESRSHTIRSKDGLFDIPVSPIDRAGTIIRIHAEGYVEWAREVYGGLSGEYDLGDISMEKLRTIRGIVRNAQTGSPMPGVRIFSMLDPDLSPITQRAGRGWSFDRITVSSREGTFTLEGIHDRIRSLFLLVPRTTFVTVDLPANDDVIEIDLNLGGVIEGSLIAPDKSPVEGDIAIVGSSWLFPLFIRSNSSFRWENLTPDVYTITATTEVGLVQKRTVTLEAGERLSEIDLIVQPGWSVRGTISGLKGIERAVIEAKDAASQVLSRRGFENGPYTVHGLPDKVTLVARASSGHTFVREFLNGNQQDSPVDFHFSDGSRLTGWVTSGGKPLGGMSLRVVPEDSEAATANVTTTESGRYEVERLLDGRHVVQTDTGHSYVMDISGDTRFDIRVPENALIGIVRGERTRRPVGGGLAKLQGINVPEAIRAVQITRRIGSDGTFSFKGLIAGDYDVVVAYPHAAEVISRVQINGSESIEMLVQCANTQECVEGPLEDR